MNRRAVLLGGLAALLVASPASAGSGRRKNMRRALAEALLALPDLPEGVLVAPEGTPVLDLASLAAHVRALPAEAELADVVASPLLDVEPVWEWATRAALVAAAGRRTLERIGRATAHREPKDLVLGPGERRVFAGSLEVAGRIVLHDGARLVVAGDVTAGDVLEHDGASLGGYYGNFAIGGDLTVAGVCSTGGMCVVAGRLTAPVILAYDNAGFLRVAGGVREEILYEFDHGGSRVWGESRIGVLLRDELLGLDDRMDPEAEWASFPAHVAPGLRGEIPQERYDLEEFLRNHALARDLLPERAANTPG